MTALILLAFGVLILVVGTIYVVVVRPRINRWGASDQEHLFTWPGDELVVAVGDRCPPWPRPLPEQHDFVMNGSSKQSREAN